MARAQERIAPEIIDDNTLSEEVSPAEAWNALDRICSSRTMHGCHRLIQLLEYLVRSTLHGEAIHLKETTIGVAVFGRKPDYDPKVDTIVRSQAWRLRAKLKKYYNSEGAADPLIIEIQVGHYVPTFQLRDPRTSTKTSHEKTDDDSHEPAA